MKSQRGFTMVEMVVCMMVIGWLIAIAAPNFSIWIQSAQIRTAAEAVQNGLQLARSEAVRRNASVRFQLTSSADNACALSTSGANWIVSQDDPSDACAATASDTVAPRIIQARASTEGSPHAVVAAGQSAIVFNALGRVTPVPAGNISIDITNPTGGTCASTGPMRCLRLVVSKAGQIRMCDPALASTLPQGC